MDNSNKFGNIWESCIISQPSRDFYVHDEFFMHENQFCLPRTYLPEKVIWDSHGGGLDGYLGRDKTFQWYVDISPGHIYSKMLLQVMCKTVMFVKLPKGSLKIQDFIYLFLKIYGRICL